MVGPARPRMGRVYLVVGAAGLAMAAAGGLGYAALAGFLRLAEDRRRAGVAIRAVDRLEALVREAESGQRGFLLTGNPNYLTPYRKAAAEAPSAVRACARDPLWPPAESAALRADAEAKLAELARTVALGESGRRPEALAVVRTGEGRRLMERIAARAARLKEGAEGSGARRERALERAAQAALAAIPAVGAVAPLAIGASAAYAARQRRARDRAEVEARAAREQARANAELLNALSHDLRTPLNAVVQHATVVGMLAEPGVARPGEVASAARAVRSAAMGLADLLAHFLEVSRAQNDRVRPERVAVADLLAEVAARVRPAAHAKRLGVDESCPPGLCVVTDRVKLARLVTNLADNAVKFTGAGAVRVSAAPRPGGGASVAVADTGPGIAPGVRDRMFGDFEQGANPERSPAKGFGLGLAIAKRLADALGATIDVWTKEGAGTTFTVHVPDLPDADPGPGPWQNRDSV